MFLFFIIVIGATSAHGQLSNELFSGYLGARNEAQMEKMQLSSLQEFQNDRVIENNLLEQPEVEAHATYVEPPADFKPIIYTESQKPALATSAPQAEPLQVSATNHDSNHQNQNQNLPHHQQQQQHQNHHRHQPAQELKPSVGRWSDWHDMSVEPDLASSDTAISQVQPQLQQPPKQQSYKNRYNSGAVSSMVNYAPMAWLPPVGHLVLAPPSQFSAGGQSVVLPSEGHQLVWERQQQQQQLPLQKMMVSSKKPQAAYWEQQVPMPTGPVTQLSDSVSNQRKLKRRRKFKPGNAEVRILRLVAASQQQQLQQPRQELSADSNQVNGLTSAYQYNQRSLQQKQVALERVVDQAQVLGEPSLPFNSNSKQRQQPMPIVADNNKVVKRLGGGVAPGNATGSASATKHYRRVKRRRVKTLLPVGLSSWFLGGIRALDGRHWHLPSEVINRLAINDVDFVRQPAPQKVVPPQAGSVALIGASQQVGGGAVGELAKQAAGNSNSNINSASNSQSSSGSGSAGNSGSAMPSPSRSVPISQQVPR